MSGLLFVAYSHGAGMVDWFVHALVSSLVNGVVFAFMFRLMRGLTLPQAVVVVAVVLGAAYLFSHARDRRG